MTRIIRKRRDEDTRRQDRLTEILQTIATLDSEMVAKAAERSRLATEAEAIYRDLGEDEFKIETDHGTYAALETRSAGRASSTIDPEGFRGLVDDDKAFFGAIKVLKEPAEALLSGKELASITTTVAGKAGDPVFVVGAVKAKAKGKK